MIIDFLYSLNIFEAFLLFGLFFSCSIQIFNSYFYHKWIDIFTPLNLFALLTLFYCVLGPIISSAQGDGSIIYRATDHREYYQVGLFAALLSFFSFKVGFDYKNYFSIKKFGLNKLKEFSLDKKNILILHKWGELTFWLVIVLQFLGFGLQTLDNIRFSGSFNIASESTFITGGLTGLLFFTFNFLIVSILLMYIALLKGSKKKTKFIFYLTITISMFVRFGFRWRLFVLLLPIFMLYYFYKKTKPTISFLIGVLISIFLAFGFIQITRSYGTGLVFDRTFRNIRLQNQSILGSALKASFFDSNVFNTSGGMIHKTPSEYSYVGIAPIINAICVFVPRQFWPNKPSGEYITNLYKKLYSFELWEVGSASLGFAEYYISGGWLALLTLNFLLGLFYKRLWLWFLSNFNDPIAQINYVTYLSFLFILYSRGYLLQITFLFITTFIPLFVFTYLWNKRIEQ